MAELMLRSWVPESELPVGSAGFVSTGIPAPPEAVEAMQVLGLDLSAHRSRMISGEVVQSAQLIVVMERHHLVELATAFPSAWPRTFTFADLLRRAGDHGARRRHETIADWAIRLGGRRQRAEILRLPLAEDIPDPMGGRLRDYVRARDAISAMVSELARLLGPA